jgi:hypothetical protein
MDQLQELYPDLVEAGGLVRALQSALRQLASPLQICNDVEDLTPSEKDIMRGWPTYARAEQNGRAC